MANSFQIAGEIVARDRKGKAILLTIRYGESRKIADKTMQFVNFARVRLPERLVSQTDEKHIDRGCVVSTQGFVQGVLHQNEVTGEATLTNEMVATNVENFQVMLGSAEARPAVSKGQDRFLETLGDGGSEKGKQAAGKQQEDKTE